MTATSFIACVPKVLPDNLAAAAARTAVEINPANAPAIEQLCTAINPRAAFAPTPDHLALLTAKYWGAGGVHLTVSFLDNPSAALRNKILEHMNAWAQHCNAKFVWTQSGGQVRISRGAGGYYSYLGTDILHIPANQQTMNLEGFSERTADSEFRRVVRHETGHALGFPHEHMRRDIVARIDPQKAIAYFARTQGWSAAMVQQQVLTPLDERSIRGTASADTDSIMCYQLPGSITRDGQPIAGGLDIDKDDAAFAATIYPPAVPPPPPPPPPNPPPPPVDAGTIDMCMRLDPAAKVAAINLPSAWTVIKLSQGKDLDMNAHEKQMSLRALAEQLDAELAVCGKVDAAAAPGGVLSTLAALVAAIRAGDWKTALVCVRDLLTIAIGDTAGSGGISFQAGMQAAGFNWQTILQLLAKILPLLLAA